MPYCNKCGMAVKESDRFCYKCGAKLNTITSLTCNKCGTTLITGARFCRNCGQSVIEADKPLQDTVDTSNPDSSLAITPKDNSTIGLCFYCYKRIPITDNVKEITCPNCGGTGDFNRFVRAYEKENVFAQMNLAELPYIKEGDDFFFGGLGRYRWNVLSINNEYIYAILCNQDKLKYKKFYDRDSTSDRLVYNNTDSPVTWETCTLRKWLNESFIERFSDKERELLAPTKLNNRNNPYYGTSGGNDTVDKVFCLSIDELKYYCKNEKMKKILMGSLSDAYWLRTPGEHQNKASVNIAPIDYRGEWYPNSTYEVDKSTRNDFHDDSIYVRPCICINTKLLKKKERNNNIIPDLRSLDVGQVIDFGFNEITGSIKWRIIHKENNQVLIITDDVIRRKAFGNKEKPYSSWETSDIRKWLNNEFLQQNFNDDERSHIIEHTITNNRTKFQQDFIGGIDTVDKVFLLSVEEANNYFASDEDRKCSYTWWSRTSRAENIDSTEDSFDACDVIDVCDSGSISKYGTDVNYSMGVRPAMWIRIDE